LLGVAHATCYTTNTSNATSTHQLISEQQQQCNKCQA